MSENERIFRNHALSGNIQELKKLIDIGVNINAPDHEGFAALHCAMIWLPHLKDKNFLEVTKILVENGADVNLVTSDGQTPLFMAACEGFYDVVVYLHEKGGEINTSMNNGFNALHEISKKIGQRPMNFSLTIERNGKKITLTDPDEIREIYGNHPDDEYLGYIKTVKYLIDNGIDVNQTTHETNQTPLFHASDEGCQEIIAMILNKGVENINHQDSWGLTPLHYASRKGHLGIVKLLIEAGADAIIKEKYGFTPLHEASENGHLEIVKFLIQHGADPKLGLIKDFSPYKIGDTPLDIARKVNKQKIVDFLSNLK